MVYSMKTRVLSLLLCLCMLMGVVPMAALADETGSEETVATEAASVPEEITETTTEVTESEPDAETEESTEESTEVTAEETTEESTGETEAEDNILTEEELASRANIDARSSVWGLENQGFTVLSDKQSTLAPGISEHKTAVYDKNGNRVEMFIAEIDTSVDTVKIFANYKDNQHNTWGMQRTTEQAAAFEANHPDHDVIVAINASYYNTSNGQPTGAFFMEGVDINGGAGNSYSFFALMKDGTYMIGDVGEYSKYKDQIQEAVGGWIHLINDGVVANLNDVEKYPRQTIGLTADNRVIIMTADGNQAPKSDGLTLKEQAEVMLAMGCVEAIHLDGGGSATYCSKAAGSDKLLVVNSPSNGSERAVSNTLMVVSTAVADGKLDHIDLTAEYSYITPGTSVKIGAVGVDASGGAAELPENLTWEAEGGTVTNGVFTSDGTEGDAIVTVLYEGGIVGELLIHVVNPDTIHFASETILVPYGKTVTLSIKALYENKEVFFAENDISVALENGEIGELNGFTFTATADSTFVAQSGITATLKANPAVFAEATVTLGKGSEVIFDFEPGTVGTDVNDWIIRPHEATSQNELGEIYIVDRNTGMVHSGEQALAFHTDFSQTTSHGSNTAGYLALSMSWLGEPISIKGAQSLGFWIYIPEDARTTEICVNTVYGNAQRRSVWVSDDDNAEISTPYWGTHMEESGWQYVRVDLSEFNDDLYIKDEPNINGGFKRNFFIKIYVVFGDDARYLADSHGDFVYYIDDITVDYSNAVEDRELPVFGTAQAFGKSETTLGYGQNPTIADSELSFSAQVSDNTKKSNYTGLDAATAQITVDGSPVYTTYSNGTISSGTVKLNNGYHIVRFTIADKNGNSKTIVRSFTVTGSKMAAVQLVPKDASLDRLYSGSVYWVDLVSENIGNVQSVDMVLNLNSVNTWELEHMNVSRGFKVTYSQTAAQRAENNVTFHISRTEDAVDTSNKTIASIPIRVWSSRIHEYAGFESRTPENMWQRGLVDPREVRVKVDYGRVSLSDATTAFFSDSITVDTEAYDIYCYMDSSYRSESGHYHVHTVTELEDQVSTCTENGYTGRTYCEVCNSVVNWGTELPLAEHSYSVVDGVLKCAYGETFTGIWTDGKEYVDGICMPDGWNEDSYYLNGAKLTGVHKVPAPNSSDEFYYDFGENGVCENKTKFNGIFLDTESGVYRYSKIGVVTGGWIMIDEEWYYFNPATMAAATGTFDYGNDITYEFAENGRLLSGFWGKTLYGTRYYYGPDYHRNGWKTIDGKDYYFDSGYRVEGGYQCVFENYINAFWYYFDENGVCDKSSVIPDGFYTDRNGYGYSQNGVGLQGLQFIDGVAYYFDNKGYAQSGWFKGYLFGEDFKGYTGIVEKSGELYYYKNGKPQVAGLVEVDGAYYFANSSDGKIARDVKTYVWQGNGIIPESTREFGADGKMLDGIVEKDGTLYYYNMGQSGAFGLVEVNGAYYFAKGSYGELAVNMSTYVWQGNGIIPESTREFGADGKMLDGIVEKNGGYYYYEMGQPKMAGLIEIDGHYYFARNGLGELVTDENYYVWMSNGLLPEATYHFDELGRMRDGIVQIGDKYFYYVNGKPRTAGLVEVNGAYYFANGSDGSIAVNKICYVWQGNGIIPESTREFGADGRMLDGIVEKNGELYYYVMGQPKVAGLVEVDGAYYFANRSDGRVAMNTSCYVWQGNGIIPESTREFGADGKMLDGIVEKNGELYYYVMGQPRVAGLVEVDGELYFANQSDGKIAVNTTCYVWQGNGIIPESTREFGADGKMLNGIVEKNGGYYYYEMGQPKMAGLILVDGYYYFARNAQGELVTNRTYYVWKTNGLSIAMNYTFDEFGRAILK